MSDHTLLALYLMRLHQHRQAYAGALADVQRCLNASGTTCAVAELLVELEQRSAELARLVERLEQTTRR